MSHNGYSASVVSPSVCTFLASYYRLVIVLIKGYPVVVGANGGEGPISGTRFFKGVEGDGEGCNCCRRRLIGAVGSP